MTINDTNIALAATAATSSASAPRHFAAPVVGDIVDCKVVKVLSDKGSNKPHGALLSFGSCVGMIRERDFCGNEAEQANRLQGLKRGDEFQAMLTKTDFKSSPARFDLSERLAASFAHAQSLVGTQVVGRVTALPHFGAFLDIGNGMSGVLFVNEMSSGDQCKRHSELKENDPVNVVVLSAELEHKPLNLRLTFSEIEVALQKTADLAGAIVTAKVIGPCNAGFRLVLASGAEAVLPSENLGGTAATSIKKGNNLKVKVLGLSGRAITVTRDGIGGVNARAVQDSKRAARRADDQRIRASMQGSSGGGGGNKGKGKK
ncbi:MAG: S1 RNA-binding domain-containing protein [Candidatus Obscuribacterales bacterium]|nr:S1 RNA-binding domain-containing protein [Candidatus Obscuribacterales bacterium]